MLSSGGAAGERSRPDAGSGTGGDGGSDAGAPWSPPASGTPCGPGMSAALWSGIACPPMPIIGADAADCGADVGTPADSTVPSAFRRAATTAAANGWKRATAAASIPMPRKNRTVCRNCAMPVPFRVALRRHRGHSRKVCAVIGGRAVATLGHRHPPRPHGRQGRHSRQGFPRPAGLYADNCGFDRDVCCSRRAAEAPSCSQRTSGAAM